jgi:hypothetical protein
MKMKKINIKDLTPEQYKKYDDLCKEKYKMDIETMRWSPWTGGTGFIFINDVMLTFGW